MNYVDSPLDMVRGKFSWGTPYGVRSLGWVVVTIILSGIVSLRAQNVSSQAVLPPLPQSAQWAGEPNLSPGNGETVSLNPPVFSWFSAPGIPEYVAYDTNVYQYILQADYNGSFTNPVLNVATYSCCYNFVGPFTNSPVFWRVGYLYNPSNTMASLMTNSVWTTNSWITNSFSIASSATVWDRSVLADTNYLAGKAHPYIIFNGQNNSAIGSYYSTVNPSGYQYAMQGNITSLPAWYQNPVPWTGSVDYASYASIICQSAFMWEVSGSPAWTNLLCTNFDNLVNYFMAGNLWSLDYGNGASPTLPMSMALCYDWLYPIMTPLERSNALNALRWEIRAVLYNGFWVCPATRSISCFPSGNGDMTSTFPGPLWVPYIMSSKMGGSHPWMCVHEAAFYEALACFNDDRDAGLLLNLDLNYLIGRVTPYGAGAVNQGRGYALESTFDNGTVDNNLLANLVFPEAHLNANPVYQDLAEWWMHLSPPGYDDVHEQWGDVDFNTGAAFWHKPSCSRDLALLTQNGNVSMAGNQFNLFTGPFDGGEPVTETLYPFFYPTPAPTLDTNLGACYQKEGWAFGSTYPANTTNCFYSGVGFAMMARPRGSEAGHSHFNDLDFEIWAYGANITDGAGGSYTGNHASWMANTVQINGLGQVETEEQPMAPVVAQITAFTNAPDYVYVAADATPAYPHQPFLYDYAAGGGGPDGWLMGQFGGSLAGGPLSYVSAVHRELLFEHRKYFVVYDTIQTTNAPTNTFSWVYHIFENSLGSLNAGSFNYTSFTWNYTGNGVSGFTGNYVQQIQTYVFQVDNPNELTSIDMGGTNAYSNPLTGENYYAAAAWDQVNGTGNTPSAHTIWVNNTVPTNKFHFMTVIYPVAPGSPAPTFTRLDDDTVQVVAGTNTDIITFNPESSTNASKATFTVDSPGIWAGTAPLPGEPNLTGSAYYVPVAPPVVSSAPPSLPAPSNLRIVPPAATSSSTNLPPTSTFAPVSGYLAWWNPDVLSGGDTAPVPNWMDLSPNGFTLSQPNFPNQPMLRLNGPNGHNYVTFNGISDFLVNTSIGTLTQPVEVFCVVSVANLNSYGAIAGNCMGGEAAFGVMNGSCFMNAGDLVAGGTATTGWVELTAVLDDVSAKLYVNGNLAISGNRIGNDTQEGEAIGAAYNNGWGLFFNGSLGDIVVYNNVLSPTDQQTVEQGLRAKYGF